MNNPASIRKRAAATGFTLIELVTVIVLIGVLAVMAIPRFADRSVFESRGFQDETKALLRWAQKSAIAQRRTVCVYFTATDAWAHVRSGAGDTSCGVSASPADAPPAGQVWLADPRGQANAWVGAIPGNSYATTPAGFNFEPLGRPSAGSTIAVTGSGTVTVEAETGYVH